MTVATFIIAVLGFAVACASFGWNIASFLLQGQRVSLDVTPVLAVHPVTGIELEPLVQITVRAIGRQPVEVTGWSLTYPDNLHLHSTTIETQYGSFNSVHMGDKMPKTIQPGSNAFFNLPTVAIKSAATNNNLDPRQGHIQVYFAARKPLRDKKSISERLKLDKQGGYSM